MIWRSSQRKLIGSESMITFSKLGSTIWQGLVFFVKHRQVRRGSAIIFFLAIFTLLLSLDFFYGKVSLEVGDVAPHDIRAPHSVEFIDPVKTDELRQQAAQGVDKVYTTDPQITLAVENNIINLTADIAAIQLAENLDIDENLLIKEKAEKLRVRIPFTLSEEALLSLASGVLEDLYLVQDKVINIVNQKMKTGITEEQLEGVRGELIASINEFNLNQGYYQYAVGLVHIFLQPNRFYNPEQTDAVRQKAMAAVEPVKIKIKSQQRITSAGEIVTRQHIQALHALNILHPRQPWVTLLGTIFLVAAFMAVVLFYLRRQNRKIYQNTGQLYLIGIVIVIVLAVSKSILAIDIFHWPELEELLGYTAPVAAAGMLIAILLKTRLAVLVVTVISLFLGLMIGNQINFSIVGFLGGIAGVYSVSRLSQRGDLVRAGLYTGITVMLAIFVIGMIEETPWQLLLLSGLMLGLLNGLLSSVLTNGALPYLESSFGITSPVKLLELSNPSNPLLRKLLTEVPGTYHHSIMVGNLAEAATEAVGGDHLLVRVGALYHDIGKIKRPYFFIENQMGADNPHDKIAPSLSTLIVTSHVKDGVDLAKEHKLPQCIIDFIEQHHGTGLIKFFYHKALKGEKPELITEKEFSYTGPKPQTKETAIVMLADTVEAAVRSLKTPTPGQVEGLVRKIIKEKLMEGQLDQCDLTLKDLDTTAKAFLRVLSGVYHSRIEYPEIK